MIALTDATALFSVLVDPLSIFGFPVRLPDVATISPRAGEPMKYLCLVYHEEAKLDALPASEYDELVHEDLDYREELGKSGHHIASSPLESVQSATTIRVRNGKLAITDGPFAETREQLGGFYLIEARDLNEAIRVAAKMPPARLGCIEVRPLREFNCT
jgi:hypothetical protein